MGESIDDLIEESEGKLLTETRLELTPEITNITGIERLTRLGELYVKGDVPSELLASLLAHSTQLSSSLKKVEISENYVIGSLSFLENCKSLEIISLPDYCHLTDFSFLMSTNLAATLKELTLRNCGIEDISFLRQYTSLERVKLGNCEHIPNISLLSSNVLSYTLHDLDLTGLNYSVKDLNFLERYASLRKLRISICDGVEDFSILGSRNLAKTLNELDLQTVFPKDISFLEKYESLEKLSLHLSRIDSGFSVLSSKNLSSTLKSLRVSGGIKDISFLEGYTSLEELTIKGGVSISDFSVLNSKNLIENLKKIRLETIGIADVSFLEYPLSLEELTLSSCVFIQDLSVLNSSNLKDNIKKLNLTFTPHLEDITLFLDYKNLRSLLLSHQNLNWFKVVDGKFINQETIQTLREKGVNVDIQGDIKSPDFEQQPCLYLVCGPSGSGKSTLIKDLRKEMNVKQLVKSTSRELRNGETPINGAIFHRSLDEMTRLYQDKKLLFFHEYVGNLYGIGLSDFSGSKQSNNKHLFDTCDIDAAYRLRELYPGFVKVIALIPTISEIEQGLQRRNSYDKQNRLPRIKDELNLTLAYSQDADYVVHGNSWKERKDKIKEILKT